MASKIKVSSSAQKKLCHGAPTSPHFDHADDLPRLRRAKGQIEGIEKMILEKRYCVDILQQIKAARSALKSLEASVLKNHLRACVREAFASKDPFDADKKIQEIADLLAK